MNLFKKYKINKEKAKERLDEFFDEENTKKRNYARKYSDRMEYMIVENFDNAPKGQSKRKTAELIHADFTAIFSPAKMKGITAKGILKKYYAMTRDARAFEEGTGIYSDDKPLVESTACSDTPSMIRDLIFSSMKESEDMTISIQGSVVTVTFK